VSAFERIARQRLGSLISRFSAVNSTLAALRARSLPSAEVKEKTAGTKISDRGIDLDALPSMKSPDHTRAVKMAESGKAEAVRDANSPEIRCECPLRPFSEELGVSAFVRSRSLSRPWNADR
jgi:hypothetical protein